MVLDRAKRRRPGPTGRQPRSARSLRARPASEPVGIVVAVEGGCHPLPPGFPVSTDGAGQTVERFDGESRLSASDPTSRPSDAPCSGFSVCAASATPPLSWSSVLHRLVESAVRQRTLLYWSAPSRSL